MPYINEGEEIIIDYFQKYGEGNMNNEIECENFMFSLEQHLAFKDIHQELNSVENRLFYTLLSNNSRDNGYPSEMVKAFQKILNNTIIL